MERRRIRDELDACACLDAAAGSGLPRAQWARDNGIDARSLQIWRLIVERKRAARPAPLRLVELTAPPGRPATYAVCVGEFRVEVGDDFADATLRRLLSVVASC